MSLHSKGRGHLSVTGFKSTSPSPPVSVPWEGHTQALWSEEFRQKLREAAVKPPSSGNPSKLGSSIKADAMASSKPLNFGSVASSKPFNFGSVASSKPLNFGSVASSNPFNFDAAPSVNPFSILPDSETPKSTDSTSTNDSVPPTPRHEVKTGASTPHHVHPHSEPQTENSSTKPPVGDGRKEQAASRSADSGGKPLPGLFAATANSAGDQEQLSDSGSEGPEVIPWVTEQVAVTEFRPISVRLVWRVEHWRCSRHYHDPLAPPLVSPEVQDRSGCRWRMELSADFVLGSPRAVRVVLRLVRCPHRPPRVFVAGTLGLADAVGGSSAPGPVQGLLAVGGALTTDAWIPVICDRFTVAADLQTAVGEATSRLEAASGARPSPADADPGAALAADLRRLQADPGLSDAAVWVGGAALPCHMALVRARAPRLAAGFEAARAGHELRPDDDATPEAWTALLRFLYSGDTDLGARLRTDIAEQLLGLAHRYDVPALTQHVAAGLAAGLTRDTALATARLALRFELGPLRLAAVGVVRRHLGWFRQEGRYDLMATGKSDPEIVLLLSEELTA